MSKILRIPENLSQFDDYLEYDPKTGDLFWIKKPHRGISIGQKAGSICENKRIHLRLNKKQYFAHHVAWYLYFNYWPNDCIDHINGDPLDNRIENLRIVSHALNMQNQRQVSRRNCSGFSGVWKTPSGKYRASISVNGKTRYLGTFISLDDARNMIHQTRKALYEGYTL